MGELVEWHVEDLQNGERCLVIDMAAPRANALEPRLLGRLHEAFDALEAADASTALITGGANFSTGGDVGRFAEAAASGDADQYAEQVVPVLQELVLRIIDAPVIVASAIRGATTGGSAGLVFASDLTVAAPDAFVQPYYGVVGFAPDGGWLALLPELIGGAAARGWVMANHRYGPDQLERLGLVHAVDPEPEMRARAMLSEIAPGTALATKKLFWHEARRADVKALLDGETDAFRSLIGRPETLRGMQAFLGQRP